MPTLAQIREAIRVKVAAVAGIGIVHDYERYAAAQSEFKALFLSAGQVRGWLVRHLGLREQAPYIGRTVIDHGWQIRGYMALDDSAATEKTFDNLVEAIVLAFRNDDSLGGLIATMNPEDQSFSGVREEDSGPVMFAGVLCHSARLALTTRHYE